VPLAVRLSRGLDAFAETLAPLAWLAAIAGAALTLPTASRPVRRLLALGLWLVAVQSLYAVWIGGDAWDFDHSNRFIAAAVPVLLAGVAAAAPDIARFADRAPSALVFIAINVVGIETLWLFPAFDPPSNRTMLAGWAVAAGFGAAAFAAGPSTSLRRRLCTTGALIATVVILSGHSWTRWALDNGTYVPNDIGAAELGLALGETLPADATIAAGWLGAPAYFSGLRAIDIYGKTDRHVARAVPSRPFRPGHNKLDLAYSIGELKPDVVLSLLDGPEVASFGYVQTRTGVFVRRDSRAAHADHPRPVGW